MGDDRDGPFGAVPSGAGSSGRVWENITAGWADPLRTEADYAFALDRLIEYFTRGAHDLTEARSREIIDAAVTQFRAQWHADVVVRHRRGGSPLGPSPKELATAVHNEVLDHLQNPSDSPDDDLRGPSEREDEWLALRAVGAKPEVVRAGLSQLVASRQRTDFLIVTQWLDLADRDRTRPPRSVQVVTRLAGEVTGEEVVRRAIISFRERLKRIKGDDV